MSLFLLHETYLINHLSIVFLRSVIKTGKSGSWLKPFLILFWNVLRNKTSTSSSVKVPNELSASPPRECTHLISNYLALIGAIEEAFPWAEVTLFCFYSSKFLLSVWLVVFGHIGKHWWARSRKNESIRVTPTLGALRKVPMKLFYCCKLFQKKLI
jgi:hypothetical protein